MPKYATNPDARHKAAVRLKGALAAGAVVLNTVVAEEYLAIAGSARVKARIKTDHAGTLDLTFGFFSNDVFTAYATGNPTQVVVSANTEAQILSDTYGEAYCRVRFTPGADGVITYCDVSQT